MNRFIEAQKKGRSIRKSLQNTITKYYFKKEDMLGEVIEPRINYDILSVIMINLAGPSGENFVGLVKLLYTIFSSEIEKDVKEKILQEEFNIPMTREIREDLALMESLGCGLVEQGLEQGREEGLEEGVAKGQLKALKAIMETLNLDLEHALDALKIPKKEQQQYIDLLNQQ